MTACWGSLCAMNSIGQLSALSASDDFASGRFLQTSQRPPVPGEEDARRHSPDDVRLSTVVATDKVGCRTSKSGRAASDGCKQRMVSKLDHQGDSVDPPLGFEPEGSTSISPRFNENLSVPSPGNGGVGGSSYLRWAESLKTLLEDSEGVRLFKQFLEQEQGCSAALDFWFACTGLKMVADDAERVAGLAKMIYKRYVKGDRLRLSAEVRRLVVDRLRQRQIDATLFDEAQSEVEFMMRDDAYPLFLKSDTYLQYVQSGGESPRTSGNGSSNCNSVSNTPSPAVPAGADPMPVLSRPLPTVAEDEELGCDDIRHASVLQSPLSLTHSTLLATRRAREAVTPAHYFGISFPRSSSSKLSNPYHVSYAPASAQDSELQSLSSDALTDDTMSFTDSSVDGRERVSYTSKRKQMKAIRRNIDANQQTDLNQPLIPRTERVPPDSNIAESDPKKFAQMLSDKLQRVKEDEERSERIANLTNSLRINDNDDSVILVDSSNRHNASNSSMLSTSVDSFPYTSMLLRSGLTDCEIDDNAQNILEEHVLRVWDRSNGPTPGGGFSPGLRTPNQHRSSRCAVAALVAPLTRVQNSVPNSSKQLPHRTRDETIPSSHHDDRLHGGALQSSVNVRHSHRHQPQTLSSSSMVIKDSSRDAMLPRQFRSHGVLGNAEQEIARRSNTRKNLDGGAVVSSASRVQDLQPSHVPEVASERVKMWMQKNEIYCAKPRYSTDGSDKGSSQNKRSHRSSGSGTGKKSTQQQQQPQQPRPNRSESLDRGDIPVNHARSFVGNVSAIVSSRDNHAMPPPRSAVQNVSSATSYHNASQMSATLSSSCEDLSLCGTKVERPAKKLTAEHGGLQTIVGYYFCDEPIPYRTTIPGKNVTLGQFKQHISKKGNYRYFFKTLCQEFESGVVNEEVSNDNDLLPLFEGKIVGKVERMS